MRRSSRLADGEPSADSGRRLHPCAIPVLLYGASLVGAIVTATVAGDPAFGTVCILGALIMLAGPAASLSSGFPELSLPQTQRLVDAMNAVDDDDSSRILVAAQQDVSVPWTVRRRIPPMVFAACGFVDACNDEELRVLAALALSQLRDAGMTAYAKRFRAASYVLIFALAIAGTQIVPRSDLIYGAFAPLGLAQWITIVVASAASRRQGLARTFARADDAAIALGATPELVAKSLRSTAVWRKHAKTKQTPLQRALRILGQPVPPNWHEASRAHRLDPQHDAPTAA